MAYISPETISSIKTSFPLSNDWRRWLPELGAATRELERRQQQVRVWEAEVARIAYCLSRDRAAAITSSGSSPTA